MQQYDIKNTGFIYYITLCLYIIGINDLPLKALCAEAKLPPSVNGSYNSVELTTDDISYIRQELVDNKFPVKSIPEVADLLRKMDHEHWPDVLLLLIQSQKHDTDDPDVYPLYPFYGLTAAETGQSLLIDIAVNDFSAMNPDLRIVDAVRYSLKYFSQSNGASISALSYINMVNTPESNALVIELLDSSYRSVAGTAAMLAGKRHIIGSIPKLHTLANSPSPRLRDIAVESLSAFGEKPPNEKDDSSLLLSAKTIVTILRKLGLSDSMIIDVLKEPELVTNIVPWYLPLPASQLIPRVRLNDTWRIMMLDSISVQKRAMQYHMGFGYANHQSGIHFNDNDVTGPFLLAAAIETNDTNTIRMIYQDMSDQYENDDDTIQHCIDYMSTRLLELGLDAYFKFDDTGAIKILKQMDIFAPYAKPYSDLSLQIKKSRRIIEECTKRAQANIAHGKMPVNTLSRVAYLIDQITEISGHAETASDWTYQQEWGPIGEELLKIGRPALPALVEAAADSTPTHISIKLDYLPEELPSNWVSVSAIACGIIQKICQNTTILPLPPQPTTNRQIESPFQARERLRTWLKSIPP